MEYVFGPFLLVSMDYLIRNLEKFFKDLLISLAGILPLTILVYRLITKSDGGFNIPCSPLVGSLVEFFKDDYYKVCIAFVYIMVVCIFLYVMIKHGKKKYTPCAVCVIFIVFNILCSMKSVDWLANTQKDTYEVIKPAVEMINSDEEDRPIYFITDSENFFCSTRIKFLQFVLYNRPINVVNAYGQINYEGDYILITNPKIYPVLEDAGIDYVLTTSYLNVYEVEGHTRGNKID